MSPTNEENQTNHPANQPPEQSLENSAETAPAQPGEGCFAAEAPALSLPPPTAESAPPVEPPAVSLDSVLGVAETLSDGEKAEFQTCEAIIAAGWQSFLEVGLALARIRDARLYRVEYDNFQAYCRAKWEYGRNYVDRLISAAQVFTHLMTICHQQPQYESQVRPLIGLTPEQAQLAWTCAVETARGRKITARLVKKAVQELGFAPQGKPPVSQVNRKAKAERRKLINDTIGQLLVLISQKAAYETLLQHVEALQRHIQPLLETQPHAQNAAP